MATAKLCAVLSNMHLHCSNLFAVLTCSLCADVLSRDDIRYSSSINSTTLIALLLVN